jgi:hypothetical protein
MKSGFRYDYESLGLKVHSSNSFCSFSIIFFELEACFIMRSSTKISYTVTSLPSLYLEFEASRNSLAWSSNFSLYFWAFA